MSENTNSNTVLTEKEVFDQIVLLQKQLTENSPTSLHRLGEALSDARGEADTLTDEQVSEICRVFSAREDTLNQMLCLYQRMYNDLKKEQQRINEAEKSKRAEKIELIQSIQYSMLDKMVQVLDEDDLLELANNVRGKIDAMCTDILCDKI